MQRRYALLFAVLWLVLIYCERNVLLAGGCWLILVWCKKKHCWLDAINRVIVGVRRTDKT